MIKKKVCLLGAFAVGKTSLVQRFVNSIFSEKYLTTIGVKIDQKIIPYEKQQLNMLIWDIHGEDDFQQVKPQYLSGASGCLMVMDGTRRNTIDTARKMKKMMEETVGNIPFLGLINKSDLLDEWEIKSEDIELLGQEGWKILITSAKTGDEVEHAFHQLAGEMLHQ